MMNDVSSITENLVILSTYKLILVTVLQSGNIGSDHAFVYFLVSTGYLEATK